MPTWRALHAEALKLKRTLALRLAIWMPLLMVALQFLMAWQNGVRPMFDQETPWMRLMQQTLVFWSLLVLPLFVTLETALLAGMEHGDQGYQGFTAARVFSIQARRRSRTSEMCPGTTWAMACPWAFCSSSQTACSGSISILRLRRSPRSASVQSTFSMSPICWVRRSHRRHD